MKGPSISYVVPLLVVFLLSKIGNFLKPLRRHSLWEAPKAIWGFSDRNSSRFFIDFACLEEKILNSSKVHWWSNILLFKSVLLLLMHARRSASNKRNWNFPVTHCVASIRKPLWPHFFYSSDSLCTEPHPVSGRPKPSFWLGPIPKLKIWP